MWWPSRIEETLPYVNTSAADIAHSHFVPRMNLLCMMWPLFSIWSASINATFHELVLLKHYKGWSAQMTGVWPGFRNAILFRTMSIACLTKAGTVDLSVNTGEIPISAGRLVCLTSSHWQWKSDHITIPPLYIPSLRSNQDTWFIHASSISLNPWTRSCSGLTGCPFSPLA